MNESILPGIRELGIGLRNLQVLSVARCGLVELDGIVSCMPALTHLLASGNMLQEVSALAGHESLIVVDLEGNRISDEDSITGLGLIPSLQSLRLWGNPLCFSLAAGYRASVVSIVDSLAYLDDEAVKEEEQDGGTKGEADLVPAQRGSPMGDPTARMPSGSACDTVSVTVRAEDSPGSLQHSVRSRPSTQGNAGGSAEYSTADQAQRGRVAATGGPVRATVDAMLGPLTSSAATAALVAAGGSRGAALTPGARDRPHTAQTASSFGSGSFAGTSVYGPSSSRAGDGCGFSRQQLQQAAAADASNTMAQHASASSALTHGEDATIMAGSLAASMRRKRAGGREAGTGADTTGSTGMDTSFDSGSLADLSTHSVAGAPAVLGVRRPSAQQLVHRSAPGGRLPISSARVATAVSSVQSSTPGAKSATEAGVQRVARVRPVSAAASLAFSQGRLPSVGDPELFEEGASRSDEGSDEEESSCGTGGRRGLMVLNALLSRDDDDSSSVSSVGSRRGSARVHRAGIAGEHVVARLVGGPGGGNDDEDNTPSAAQAAAAAAAVGQRKGISLMALLDKARADDERDRQRTAEELREWRAALKSSGGSRDSAVVVGPEAQAVSAKLDVTLERPTTAVRRTSSVLAPSASTSATARPTLVRPGTAGSGGPRGAMKSTSGAPAPLSTDTLTGPSMQSSAVGAGPAGFAAPAYPQGKRAAGTPLAGSGDWSTWSEQQLVQLLRQKPKHTPQLHSKDAFRRFFAGIQRDRLHALLTAAFGGLDATGGTGATGTEAKESTAERIERRMQLMDGCFS